MLSSHYISDFFQYLFVQMATILQDVNKKILDKNFDRICPAQRVKPYNQKSNSLKAAPVESDTLSREMP